MPPAGAAFGALRHRNFRIFLIGQFISLCGSWMQTVALSWLALVLSNSPLQVGLVVTFGALPVLLFTLYGGVVADRVNRRRALLFLQSLLLIEALALGFLTAFHLITMPLVYGLAALGGLVSAFEIPIRQSWQVELVGKPDLMNAIALNSTAFNLSRVVGPAIAGTLLATLGSAVCFFLNAASFLAVLIGLTLIRSGPGLAGERVPRRSRLREGIAHVFGSPWPKALVSLTAVLSVFGSSFVAILPVYARDVLRAGAGGYGALMSSFGVGAAAGALSVAGLGHRLRRERTALAAAVGLGATLALLALVHQLGLALFLLLAAGLSMALNAIMTNTLLQTEAPDHLRGQVMGFYSFIVVGMAPFGSLQAGWIAEHAGTGVAMLVGGSVCFLVAGLLAWRMLRRPGAVATHPAPAAPHEPEGVA
jgi:MFS family permease